jgi:hypothetical protein
MAGGAAAVLGSLAGDDGVVVVSTVDQVVAVAADQVVRPQ